MVFQTAEWGQGGSTPHHAHPRPPSSTHQSHLSLGTWLENGMRGAVGWTALLKRLGDAESIIPGVEGGTQAPRVPAQRRNGIYTDSWGQSCPGRRCNWHRRDSPMGLFSLP